ncbi:MAG: ribonuclease H-like domain-containing protein [Nanoarchaeota archaeon]|nr:ribonuclease H-like domain-containing protein [Nanoarchaeota archaeon]
MELKFVPLDYDYVDRKDGSDKAIVRVFGRTEGGKRICVIDSAEAYFYILPKSDVDLEKFSEKVKKIKLSHANRTARVTDVKIVKKKFMGKDVGALQVFINNPKDMNVIKDVVKEYKETAEKKEIDINFITRYIIDKNVRPLQWHSVEGEKINGMEYGDFDVDIVLEASKISPSEGKEFKPNVLAFDIETTEFDVGKGEITMLSLVNENIKKVITWKKFKNPSKEIEFVKNEEELLERFVELIKQEKPDILTGYFSDGFDFPYLRARADMHGIKLGIGLDGSNVSFIRGGIPSCEIRGLVHVDLFKFVDNIISANLQSETISLNDVAKELIGEEKLEIDLNKITKEMKDGKSKDEEMRRFALYNLQDSVLTSKLFEKLWPNIAEMTKIVSEPLFDVSRSSYSQLVEDYIIHDLKKFNEIAENRPIRDEIEERRRRPKYIGAFVKEPTPGLFEDVSVFDFRSFYPNVIVSFNISAATLHDKKESGDYETPEFEFEGKKRKFYFEKSPGFIPQILNGLLERRKEVKSKLKKNRTPIHEAEDYALKTLANATYGYFGFFGARYYSLEAAASITAICRHYIHSTIDNIEKKGFNVIYSDSVDGKTKVFVKKNEEIYEEEIERLFEKIDKTSFGKEYNFKKDLEVLTLDEKGNSIFKPMKYVMRHSCNKKMYRVNFTNNWYIDVTEDHSLMGYQSLMLNRSRQNKQDVLKRIIEIKPSEIHNKSNSIISMKNLPYQNCESKGYPKEVYEFMGYFIGDGSFMRNKAHQKANKDYYLRLSLGSDQKEVFNRLITPLTNLGYITNHWFSKTRKGDVVFNGLNLVKLISKTCRDKAGKKAIPKWLFDEKEENIAAFLKGLFSADGCVMIRNNAPVIKYTSIEDSYIENVRKLLYRVGISHSVFKENTVNKYKSKNKIYSSGSHSKNILIKNKEDFCKKIGFILERKNKLANIKTQGIQKKDIKNFDFDIQGVKNVEEIKTPKYVYDLEVEKNHRFFANYVLVHNTDSVMFLLGNKSEKEALKVLEKINESLPGTMELELEKFYKRGIFVMKKTGEAGAKKKYALLSKDGTLKIRGFESVRRDKCDLAKEMQEFVIKKVLEEGKAESALKHVTDLIKKVKEKKIFASELIIRTQLTKPIEEYSSIGPHVAVAKRMREKGIPIKEGGLVEYVVRSGTEKLIRERARIPDEVKEGEYDSDYYINNQIVPAIEGIFQVFNISVDELKQAKKKKQKSLGEF